MKKLSIILFSILLTLAACTKSKEVHPELGDGNDEILTVGVKDIHVEYYRTDMERLEKVYFYYRLAALPEGPQYYNSAEMTKREKHFEMTLTDLLPDTLYYYYYLMTDDSGRPGIQTGSKTFRTMAPGLPEPPTPPSVELPTVVTMEVSEITNNSAMCGGDVTNDGGAEITERGICWSTNENPTLNDNHIAVGNGIGTFTETIDGLEASTTYHVRAYATNEAGTTYGLDKEFATVAASGSSPVGAIDGLFSINANGDQVYFSQGNLQYQASTNTWRFAENQFDFVGGKDDYNGGLYGNVYEGGEKCDNKLISSNYEGWIDLFNWGTSGYNHGANYYQPWNIGGNTNDYHPYGCSNCNLFDYNGQADWGYNAISNGGNVENLWRTLTFEEWEYVLNNRLTNSGSRYVKAKVNDVNGIILLPDSWQNVFYSFNGINQGDANYEDNSILESVWKETLEFNGAVFLPAAGWRQRFNDQLAGLGMSGVYWSSTRCSSTTAYRIAYSKDNLNSFNWEFYFSVSVRLVQNANE